MNEVVLRPVELEAYGLLLRPWEETPGDLDAALRGLGDPDVRRWNTAHAAEPDEDGARGFLRRRRDGWAAGDLASFAVTEAGVVLGQTGIGMIDHAMRGARVSYWMLPEARGRGVATRALETVTRWAFRDLGLHRLELGHAVGNEPSCGVARRCGYVLEGVLREAVVDLSGTLRDVHLHSRLASDPRP
ncbi:Protein N-acetyltransferase, RimJ/RimL family [Actinacidiphila glaucinigra]|uniref:Protein N-acetyltransferase, RimJ/RimL family n=1 Tax=Actinacidiphila glaucinigra TaxID=235986 RepID=A0A239AZQ0_9ACTN|nr:Protein N-acetyltransferase, RimJ/RimL family [Actinacidiphila glaucinigra]